MSPRSVLGGHSGALALGGHLALGHLENTRGALGHSGTYGTRAIEHLGHSGISWVFWTHMHSGT